MASPFFSLYLLQEWFSTLFAGRSQGTPGCTGDEVILSTRQEDDPKQGILGIEDLKHGLPEISETCDAGLQQDSKDGEMLQPDGPSTHGRRSQHIHEGMCEMSTAFSSPANKPFLPCFILDSRAARHVASNVSVFSSSSSFITAVAPPESFGAVTYLAHGGTQLAVAGVGTVSCDNFHLTDVLYVPGMRTGVNLVSVQQLAERDYLVMFGGGECSVRERSTGKIVGKGRLHDDDGLYHLDFLTIP